MHVDLTTLCAQADSAIRDVMNCMDRSRMGIVLIVDPQRKLVGTVTDGDVRRALLARCDLDQSVSVLLARKAGTPFAQPITAPAGANPSDYLRVLKQHNVVHLPLVDAEQRIVGLITLDDFISERPLPPQAIVMAGGMGQRLRPLTEEIPKPMLRIGDRPLLEIIIEQLRGAGIRQVKVTTHHKREKITEHFGDGRDFGVALSYVEEDKPLGTVGGLGLLDGMSDETLLVMNGDILTQLDFRAMLAYHREHRADLTVAVRHYDFTVPYGVIHCEGSNVTGVSEKPVFDFFVNAGIYLLEPVVRRFIPTGQRFDMTDLIQCLVDAGRAVVSFPIREYWLDIGQHADYAQAQASVKNGMLQP